MPEERTDVRLERAIEEFQQYLSDILPPLVVSDSLQFLIACPPDLAASNIYSWVTAQLRTSRSISMTDYFYHAMKKIHLLGEYHLISKEEIASYLEMLKPIVLSYCPAGERETLRENLNHMDGIPTSLSSAVEVLYRQNPGGSLDSATTTRAGEASVSEGDIHRLTLLMSRIEKELSMIASAGDADMDQKQRDLVSEALAQAARSARVSVELERALEQLKRMGVSAGTEDVFRALGRQLPEWSLAPRVGVQVPEDSNLKAMYRIVTQVQDPKEGATRFHQMVRTAIERFNEGHLSQAVAMIEVAERIIAAKEVEESVTESIRRRGHEDLDVEKLRKFAESSANYAPLRKLLYFFEALSPVALMESLHRETRRDRRRMLLALLEVHGEATRTAALEALRPPLNANPSNEEGYFRRNLIHLLRRIPAGSSENFDELVGIIARHASLSVPTIILKESIAYLGQLKGERAEAALISLFNEIEALLLSSEEPPFDLDELHLLLDRLAAALGRMGTVASRHAIIDHAFKRKPKLGDAIRRLTEISTHDLGTDAAALERLLLGLKESLPKKLFGIVIQERDHDIECIVKALSGTSSPAARNGLQEIAERFPDRPSGQAALKALSGIKDANLQKPSAESNVSSLAGDLDFFSLPALLQSLSDNGVTGTLSLTSRDGNQFGSVGLQKGMFTFCEAGSLSGESAVYQLLERPCSGTFQFVRSFSTKKFSEPEEVLPLILEGIRRFDELREAEALLPDNMRLSTKSNQPAQLPEEKDGLLFRELWTMVRNGATPRECEASVQADAYRVRRLLVHWIEAGCIEAAPA
jgi:Domain of unknown function (DUF4388)